MENTSGEIIQYRFYRFLKRYVAGFEEMKTCTSDISIGPGVLVNVWRVRTLHWLGMEFYGLYVQITSLSAIQFIMLKRIDSLDGSKECVANEVLDEYYLARGL